MGEEGTQAAVPRRMQSHAGSGTDVRVGRSIAGKMDSPDDLTSRILAAIAQLPKDEQAEAIHALIGSLLKNMPLESILEMREEITAQFQDDIPIIASTLDLIDGQLALREIGGDADWR